jgi:YVTN family beta-propeller protein
MGLGGAILASTSAPAFASPTVTDTSAGTLLVPASISPVGTPVGSGPFDAVVSPDSGTVYVADSGQNNVFAINATTGATTSIALAGVQPNSIAISPDGSFVYAADYIDGIVEIVATATNTLVSGHITLGASSNPVALAVSPDGSRVYVVEQNGDLLEAYSTTAPYPYVGAASVGSAPTGVAISPDGKTAYVTGGGGLQGYVDVVNTTAFNTTTDVTPAVVIPVPPTATPFAGPSAIALSPNGATLYVVNNTASTLVAIPTATDIPGTPVAAAGGPDGVRVSPDGKIVYVAESAGSVKAFLASDLTSVGTFTVSGEPEAIAVSPDGDRVYAPDPGVTSALRVFNVAKLTISGPGQIAPGVATTDFSVSINDGNTPVGDYSGDVVSVDVLDSANDVAAAVSATLTLDPTTGALTASVPTADLPVGTYSIRAILTDLTTGGRIVAEATGFKVGTLAATGVDVALPLTLGGVLLAVGALTLILSRRRSGRVNSAR